MPPNVDLKEKLHRIRGSLSVIGGFVRNCEPKGDDDSTYREAAITSLDRLSRIVEEIEGMLREKQE